MRMLPRAFVVISTVWLATAAFAADTEKHMHATSVATGKGGVDPAAEEAVAAVDRFSAALAAGRLNDAAAELASDVVILEGGGAEWSAKEYLEGHAHDDAGFLARAKVRSVNRIARIDGALAWVGTESTIDVVKDGRPVHILSAETMVLQRRGDAWKIVHIHWSSRQQTASH